MHEPSNEQYRRAWEVALRDERVPGLPIPTAGAIARALMGREAAE